MRTHALTALVLVCAASCPAAGGQGIGPIPAVGDCDMATLMEKLQSVSDRCCPPPEATCNCTIDCAAVFLPLVGTCRAAMDVMLDFGDGTRDGVASQLDPLSMQCHAIPEEAIIQELRTMHDAGTCPDSFLNNVSLTNVTISQCTDTRAKCAALLAAGLSCSEDIMATGCQATCGKCHPHRRAQLAGACPLSQFASKASLVNDACCDDGSCTGIPTQCDAKCAIVYDDFYDNCANLLALDMASTDVVKYNQLHTTCSTELPIDGLVAALARCRAGDVSPPPHPPPHVQWYSGADSSWNAGDHSPTGGGASCSMYDVCTPEYAFDGKIDGTSADLFGKSFDMDGPNIHEAPWTLTVDVGEPRTFTHWRVAGSSWYCFGAAYLNYWDDASQKMIRIAGSDVLYKPDGPTRPTSYGPFVNATFNAAATSSKWQVVLEDHTNPDNQARFQIYITEVQFGNTL
eukprot:SAG11_NODE_363_length_10162_cov_28.285004_12_plen_458_part_00